MTIGSERLRAITNARELLRDLMIPKKTPRMSLELRRNAKYVLKHFPTEFDMERIATLAPEHLSDEFIFGKKEKLREQVLDYQTRYEGALQEVKMLELMLSQAICALSLVANPKRNDGTYNRCREACEVLANETLTSLNTTRNEELK